MFDCVVVGAGLAGLAAATELASRGRSFVVLEARDRIGGRLENATLSDGQVIELGGQWIADGHSRMTELINELELELLDPHDGAVAVRMGGNVSKIPSRDELDSSLNPFELSDLGEGLARFRRLADRIVKDGAWAQAHTAWLDQPMHRWISSNLRTPGGIKAFEDVFQGAFKVDASTVSLNEGLHRANSGVDLEALIAVNGGLKQRRVRGGVLQVAEHLAADLGDNLRLNCPVVRVEQTDGIVRVHTVEGEVIEAKTLIITLPPRLATVIEYDPPLPEWRVDLAAKVPAGNVIKAFLVYDEPWWQGRGHSGQMGSDEGAVRVSFDQTEGSRGVLMGFFEGPEASGWGTKSQALRMRSFADSVGIAFGDSSHQPVEYVDRDWAAEDFTGGCHGAHFAPGIWTASGPALAASEGLIHFAGAEYATRFNGYMEGAIRSGRSAATEVLRVLV